MCIHLCASSPSASHLFCLSSRHKTAFINNLKHTKSIFWSSHQIKTKNTKSSRFPSHVTNGDWSGITHSVWQWGDRLRLKKKRFIKHPRRYLPHTIQYDVNRKYLPRTNQYDVNNKYGCDCTFFHFWQSNVNLYFNTTATTTSNDNNYLQNYSGYNFDNLHFNTDHYYDYINHNDNSINSTITAYTQTTSTTTTSVTCQTYCDLNDQQYQNPKTVTYKLA